MNLGGNDAALARIQELEQQLQQSHAKLQKAENAKKKLRDHVVRRTHERQYVRLRRSLAATPASASATA